MSHLPRTSYLVDPIRAVTQSKQEGYPMFLLVIMRIIELIVVESRETVEPSSDGRPPGEPRIGNTEE